MDLNSISTLTLANRLRFLVEELRARLRKECDPVFFDVVSVELSNKKDYEVNWYGDPGLLSTYDSVVKDYFRKDSSSQSLLFLPCDYLWPDTMHHSFPSGSISVFPPVSVDSKIEKKITLENFGQPIDSSDVAKHKNRWFSRVLMKTGVGFYTFSKIEVSIVNQRFAAAIWIGFNKEFQTNALYETIIEKFLFSYALNSIASDSQAGLLLQATKAAISQVMARNMSHNVGSHVLSKLKDERDLNGLWGMDLRTVVEQSRLIETEAKMPTGGTRVYQGSESPAGLNSAGSASYAEKNASGTKGVDPQPPAPTRDVRMSERIGNEPEQYIGTRHEVLYDKLDSSKGDYSNEQSRFKKFEFLPSAQVAYFNEYLKNRMDYLADIATADPVMENAMFLYADVFKGFDRNRILLNRISGISSEKFKYSISLYLKHSDTGTLEGLNTGNDIPISMTNDILGAQAFYIILENIIRNIAKHSKAEKPVDLSVVIGDYEDNAFYEISVFDDLWRTENEIAGIVCKRNTVLNSSILLQSESRLRQNDLGTIEMDVCAAYLQRLPITEVESNDYRLKFNHDPDLTEDERIDPRSIGKKDHEVWNDRLPPKEANNAKALSTKYPKIMFAFAHEDPDPEANEVNRFSLGYKFYLKKPQEVLVVTDFLTSIPRISKNDTEKYSIAELKTFGITVISLNELLVEPKVFNHQLMYFQTPLSPEEENKLIHISSGLPKRWVKGINTDLFKEPAEFIRQVWEKYSAETVLGGKKLYFENSHFVAGEDGKLVTSDCAIDDFKSTVSNGKAEIVKRVFIDNHHYNWSDCIGAKKGTGENRNLEKEESHLSKSDVGCKDEHHLRLSPDESSSTIIFPHEWDYYDMKCSHSRVKKYTAPIDGEPDSQYGTNCYNGQILSQYIETVFTKVVIIDERIQENVANPKSQKMYAGKVDFYRYFKQQGIVIPRLEDDLEPNLNESSFGALNAIDCYTIDVRKMSIADKIKCFIRAHIGVSQFVVIHLGILEKMLDSGATKNGLAIDALLTSLLSDDGKVEQSTKNKIIITSGRGQPTSIPEGYSYIPLAPIQNALETVFDKFVLTRILYNSRGIKGNG